MAASLYGQKELAEFCEYVISSMFEVQQRPHRAPAFGREGVDTPPYTPPADGQHPARAAREPPVLVEFIAYALYRTRLPVAIVHQSLLLLSRLKQRYPSARGTASSPHRLFLSSLMLSAKISMDDTYSNKSWTIVGANFFTLREVNQMERELFAFLGWNVVSCKEELDEFIAAAHVAYAQATQARLRESAKRRRLLEEEARHEQARNAARALLRPHTYRATAASSVASTSTSSTSSSSCCSGGSSRGSLTSSCATSPSSYANSPAPYYRRCYDTSSASSSALPSASHSPVSPASAPLSAGPQTPEGHHFEIGCPQIHDSPDFVDAAKYVSRQSDVKIEQDGHSPRRNIVVPVLEA